VILRFSTPDMLNTELIDATTGLPAFHLITTLTSVRVSTGNSAPFNVVECRRTAVHQHGDDVPVADISWEGSRPGRIGILGEQLSGVTELFGSSTVRFE
jgi:hypothetical protein